MQVPREQLIDRLQEDIRQEHAAIVQVVYQLCYLGEGAFDGELSEISREEMRHLKWLCGEVARLGGRPTVERASFLAEAPTVRELMEANAAVARDAITRYESRFEESDDDHLRLILGRIIADERAHLDEYEELVEESEGQEFPARDESKLDEASRRDVEMLHRCANLEYNAVLRYIYQSYVVDDCHLSRELLEEQAQESMKHLGWFSELVTSVGGRLNLDAGQIDLSTDPDQMVEANIAFEIEARDLYAQILPLLTNSRARELVARIHQQEVFHTEEFRQYQNNKGARGQTTPADPPGPAKRPAGFTVGSLMGRRQNEH